MLPPARTSASWRRLKAAIFSRPLTASYWLACWASQSLVVGRVWVGAFQTGVLWRAVARATRARPRAVDWASSTLAVRVFAASVAACWLGRFTRGTSEPRRGLRANAGSRVLFQLATPPWTRPHRESEPSMRSGWRSAIAVVTSPPYDRPQARMRAAWPKRVVKVFRVASWSGTASVTAQPVVAYEEPTRA